MDDLSFLQEAVMVQIIKLLQLLDVQDLPYTIFCQADEELNKLYEFAERNHFFIPHDLRIDIICRNL